MIKPAGNQRTAEPITWDLRRAFLSAFPLAADTDPNAGTGEGGEGDAGAGDAGTGSGDAGSGDTGTGSGTDADPDVKDPDKKRLAAEAAEWRRKLREQEASNKALADKLREFEDKDKSELEKAVRDAAEHKQRADKLEKQLNDIVVKMSFFESGSAALFKNAATGLRLIDLDGITVGEDGTVDSKAIKAKAEALLKEQPYLAADGDSDSGTGGDQGSPSGKPNNGKRSKDQVDYEALAKKFPALRR